MTPSAVVASAQLPGSDGALALSVPSSKVQRRVPVSSLPSLPVADCSLKSKEDLERERVAVLWIGFASAVQEDSQLLAATSGLEVQRLKPLFLDRAPSTLKKHLCGWKLWVSFCAPLCWRPGCPSLPQILDFLDALSEGCFADRGRRRKRSALSVLSAMDFAAFKFQLTQLCDTLQNPLVLAWKDASKWRQSRVKEALPLPLIVVQGLEEVVVSDPCEGGLLLCAILAMFWGSLRWSDIQRLSLDSVILDKGVLKGWCWRTKSSVRGMPWALLTCGLCNQQWAKILYTHICRLRQDYPDRDFLLDYRGVPLGYCGMLSHFRRCLVAYAGLEKHVAAWFSLHSLKTTMLSWSSQLGIDEVTRSAQGHHRSAGVSTCVKRYARDGVTPQLRCQRQVLAELQGGWRPHVPLHRGTEHVDEAPFNAEVVRATLEDGDCAVLGDDDTEAESGAESAGEELEGVGSSSEASSDAGQSSEGDPAELADLETFAEYSFGLRVQGHLV